MNKIEELINSRKLSTSDLVATTVRISPEVNSFVEELAEQLGLSKQETLSTFISDGVASARKALRLDIQESAYPECNFHLLNTNKRHNINDSSIMLNEGIAAAFYEPWKLNIDRIQEGDVVFLYDNGVGIVAYGKATGDTLKRDYAGDKNEMHYQKLNDFVALKTPLKAKEIKKILGREVVFLKTMTSLPDGEKLMDVLKH